MSASSKCRTCQMPKVRQPYTQITKICYLNKTLKEILIQLVPQMENTLRDTDVVCKSCRNTLRLIVKFMERCLQTEVDLKESELLQDNDGSKNSENVLSSETVNGSENIQNNNRFDVPPLKSSAEDKVNILLPVINYMVPSKQDTDSQHLTPNSNDSAKQVCTALPIQNENLSQQKAFTNLVLLPNNNQDAPKLLLIQHKVVNLQLPSTKCDLTKQMFVDSPPTTSNDSMKPQSTPASVADSENAANIEQRVPVPEQTFIKPNTRVIQQEHNYFLQRKLLDFTDIPSLPENIESHDRIVSLSQKNCVVDEKFVQDLHSEGVKVFRVALSPECTVTSTKKKILLLGSHIVESIADNTLNCTKCNKYFSSRKRYKRHINLHKKKATKIKCHHCKSYVAPNLLESHRNEHREKRKKERQEQKKVSKFNCRTCLQEFTSKEDYENHTKVHPPFICEECGKGFSSKASLHTHKITHNPPNSFVCETCGKGYKTRPALRVHMYVHEDNVYMCDKCPKVFNQFFKLRKHIRFTHDAVSHVQCTDCDKLFKHKTALRAHYSLMHLKLKPHTCQICNKKFGRSDYLRNHIITHTGERRLKADGEGPARRCIKGPRIRVADPCKPVRCKLCGKLYQNILKLRLHLRTHTIQKRYPCKYCNLTYTTVASVKRHELTHVDCGFKFRCNTCWKKLETKEELDVHTASHTNPQHRCDHCGELFHRKYLLDSHYLLEHATPEDIEKSKQEVVYDTLQEFAI